MNRRFFALTTGIVLLVATASAVAYAQDRWFQYVCQKCGEKGAKGHAPNLPDSECPRRINNVRCGGLRKWTPCEPPG